MSGRTPWPCWPSATGERLRQGKELALVAEVRVDGKRLALAFPQTFMNESGRSAVRLVRRFKIEDLTKLVVVHDELDLPLGTVRVKAGGGLAGHNGLRSIKAWLRSDEFSRVRIGIGKPPGGKDYGVDHVLSTPISSRAPETQWGHRNGRRRGRDTSSPRVWRRRRTSSIPASRQMSR